MAEMSGFFPDVSGDRPYTADFLAKWIAAIIGNGTYNGELAVTADGSVMSVTLPAGRAWINGYHYRNDAALTLAIANADGVLNRKDIIVLRWDINARSITAQVLQGTPASTATAPAIVRTAEQYDLKLAEVSIPAGTTAITQALITDTRLDTSVCGIVTGVVSQVDTTTFYNQIAADLAAFKATNEAGFTAWVQGLQSVLDESTAGNLLNLINTHKADETVHITTLACTKSGTVYALTGLTATSGAVPVMFKAPAAYAVGDTVTINGAAYTLHTIDGSALTAGVWAAGAYIHTTTDIDNKNLWVWPSVPHNAADVGAVQGNTKAWAATAVGAPDAHNSCVLTIPNFVFSEGCQVTFTAVAVPLNDMHCCVQCGGVWYAFRTLSNNPLIGSEWTVGADVTVTLSNMLQNNGTNSTAFFSSGHAARADTASGSVAASAPGLRNIMIIGKSDTIPTGLPDGTVIFRKQS